MPSRSSENIRRFDKLAEPRWREDTVIARCGAVRVHRLDDVIDGVDVWSLRVGDMDSSTLAEPHRLGVMNQDEAVRCSAFRRRSDRDAFVAKRSLVRGVLSRYGALRPWEWGFAGNAYGRPEISPSHSLPDLSFNLSRSGEIVVCAIATGKIVGIDVEDLRGPDIAELTASILGQAEKEFVEAVMPPERHEVLYRLWTLKEAYVKARGLGLRLPIDEVQFAQGPWGITAMMSEAVNDRPERWSFEQLRLPGGCILAVAACERVD